MSQDIGTDPPDWEDVTTAPRTATGTTTVDDASPTATPPVSIPEARRQWSKERKEAQDIKFRIQKMFRELSLVDERFRQADLRREACAMCSLPKKVTEKQKARWLGNKTKTHSTRSTSKSPSRPRSKSPTEFPNPYT